MTEEVLYDPNDPDHPLRHRYLDRADHSTEYRMPVAEKIANGLGVDVSAVKAPPLRAKVLAPDVHVERVPRRVAVDVVPRKRRKKKP